MTKPDNTYKLMKTGELLPLGFVPEALEEERISQMAWYILVCSAWISTTLSHVVILPLLAVKASI